MTIPRPTFYGSVSQDPTTGAVVISEVDEIGRVAETLRTRTTTRLRDLWRDRGPFDERSCRERTATTLATVARLRAELETGLDDSLPTVAALCRALDDGDRDALARLGLDMTFTWLDDIAATMVNGGSRLTVEVARPRGHTGARITDAGVVEVRRRRPSRRHRAELELGRFFTRATDALSNVDMCVPVLDVTHARGTHDESTRDVNLLGVYGALRASGVIRGDDVAGGRFVLLPQSTVRGHVAELIERLRDSGAGFVATTDDGDVVFRPSVRHIERIGLEHSRRRRHLSEHGVVLCRGGVPTPLALGAAGYLHPACNYLVELNVLDAERGDEEEDVYVVLRAIEVVTQDRYHAMFYDPAKLTPDLVAYGMARLLEAELATLNSAFDRFDSWQAFDPEEYVTRVYPERILDEDKELIAFAIDQLAVSGLDGRGPLRVADVGCGPNLYPAMLLAPYLGASGAIDLIEASPANRAYLDGMIAEQRVFGEVDPWREFERYMVERGGQRYAGAFARACEAASVVEGSIYSLPRHGYDVVTSFFSTESITTSPGKFRASIRSLARAVKPQGFLLIAHVLGSSGYHAGADTRFPAVRLTLREIEAAYRDADLDFRLHVAGDDADRGDKARDGYDGLVIAVARPHYSAIAFRDRESWKSAPAVLDGHTLKILGHPVMEDWEKPYMKALAEIATSNGGHVLEIGFGMGISAGFVQAAEIASHTIIEGNHDIAERARAFCATARHPARVLEGLWDEVIEQIPDGSLDGILYDAYPLSKSEVMQQVRFASVALRKLRPGGVFTYFSDEVDDFPPQHRDQLILAGFDPGKIGGTVVPVDPPPHCHYWSAKTILAPVIRK